jgi:hypothetical protein
VVSFTLLPLYPREKSGLYSLHRRLDGTQSRSGGQEEDRKVTLTLTGTRTPVRWLSSPYPGAVLPGSSWLPAGFYCEDGSAVLLRNVGHLLLVCCHTAQDYGSVILPRDNRFVSSAA